MTRIFLELLNRSINAGWLVLVIILLRRLLKKAPKAVFLVLWALVGIRLICPFSLESILSLIPSAEPIPNTILDSNPTTPANTVPIANEISSSTELSNGLYPTHADGMVATDHKDVKNPMRLLNFLSTTVWAIGMSGFLLYATISSLRLRRKIQESIPLRDNIRLCDRISTPFLFGILRPRIYLPSSLPVEDAKYAIAHEHAHVKRHDHWWKPLGFLLLSVYWFHPLLWVAYTLFCRDIELACDEKVIRQLGAKCKKPYSIALINCSAPRRMTAFYPLAFGEIAVKERVKTVLHYQKPTFVLSSVAVLTCIAAALCFLTNPVSAAEVLSPEPPVRQHGTVEQPPVPAPATKPEQTSAEVEYTAEKRAEIAAVFDNRIQTWYSSFDVDENGNRYEAYNYELPEEIAEKYGTRNSMQLPRIIVYQSIGDRDSTETIKLKYGTYDHLTDTKHIERTEIVTIEIPAGGVAFYVVEDPSFIGFAILSGTYGDLSASI